MKLGWLFVMMLAGSSSAFSGGMTLILESQSIGVLGIVFGTIGIGSYFALLLLAGEIFDMRIKTEKS